MNVAVHGRKRLSHRYGSRGQTEGMKRALIVIDVQNEYFTGNLPIAHPPREESLANILTAIDTAREHGIPVIVVQHTSPARSPLFATGGHSWELHEEVGRRPYDHLMEKTMASAFAKTDLAGWLDAQEVDTLAVAGYMTQNCDESTARDAFHRGMAVEFLSDATGTLALSNRARQRDGGRAAQPRAGGDGLQLRLGVHHRGMGRRGQVRRAPPAPDLGQHASAGDRTASAVRTRRYRTEERREDAPVTWTEERGSEADA